MSAQKGWEVGAGAGISYYLGDLNTNFNLDKPGIAASLIGRYNFNERLNLKFSVNATRLSADDANSRNAYERARNLSFRSHVLDGAAQLEFNFLPYVHGSDDQFYTPYIFLGFSVFNFNPQASINGQWENLQILGTEGQELRDEYSRISTGFVYGAGWKIDLNHVWSVNFEYSGRQLNTDYFDDVSGQYTSKTSLLSRRGQLAVDLSDRSIPDLNTFQIGEPGRQRGNSRNNDSYHFFQISVLYYLGRLECPDISNF